MSHLNTLFKRAEKIKFYYDNIRDYSEMMSWYHKICHYMKIIASSRYLGQILFASQTVGYSKIHLSICLVLAIKVETNDDNLDKLVYFWSQLDESIEEFFKIEREIAINLNWELNQPTVYRILQEIFVNSMKYIELNEKIIKDCTYIVFRLSYEPVSEIGLVASIIFDWVLQKNMIKLNVPQMWNIYKFRVTMRESDLYKKLSDKFELWLL